MPKPTHSNPTSRLSSLLRYWSLWIFIFMAGKLGFVLYNYGASADARWYDIFRIWWHGFSLDLATSAYLAALPWLYLTLTIWFPRLYHHKVWLTYNTLTSTLVALILLADTALYPFWGFKLDATVFNYLDSPREAFASVSLSYIIIGLLLWLLLIAMICRLLRPTAATRQPTVRHRLAQTSLFVLMGGILFLSIRGGVGKSVTNVGQVYFGTNVFLNHAAVNPAFNVLASVKETGRLERQARYFSEEERALLYAQLQFSTTSLDTDTLLSTTRPNVLIILMEGFAAAFVESLGGARGITPEFDALSREGIFFTRCYANSFRTDRGTVSTLSGYPAFPAVSVMKMPDKARRLPGIATALAAVGYTNSLLYGGDINFTNAQAYFRSTGYTDIRSDKDFSLAQRTTHAWGVTDSITFEYLYDMIARQDQSKRAWHTMYQTLASHEPWEVPYDRIKGDKMANGMAYLDHHLGKFIRRIKQSPMWDNLLIICIPDHSIQYPKGITEADLRHSHIPQLWLGGVIKTPRRIDKICSQSDMAATLLGQLRLPHDSFTFSRDVLSKTYTYPCALHTWSGGLMFIDSTGHTAYDLTADKVMTDQPHPSPHRLSLGKALLQTQMQDFINK